MSDSSQNKVRLYGCGSAGRSIISKLPLLQNFSSGLQSNYATCYIDTHNSNLLRNNLPPKDTYLIDDLNDSGSLWRQDHRATAAVTEAVLQQFPPAPFNLVVHCASDAPAGTLAPALVAELLKRDQKVFAIVMGPANPEREDENNRQTLQRYESLSNQWGKKVSMVYLQNQTTQSPERTVTHQAAHVISLLLGLFDGEPQLSDRADSKMRLNLSEATNKEPSRNTA